MDILWIDETASTNSYLKAHGDKIAPMTLVAARRQTAGRGQRGNSWEAEPGKNLTFSFYLQPRDFKASDHFALSQAVSLAMSNALAGYSIEAKVKWPNDIYVGEDKIAGILIENTILGDNITRSIAGVGLNVNQTDFLSDAPNPVSMKLLSGLEYDLEDVAATVGRSLEKYVSRLSHSEALQKEYMANLWRRTGKYFFRETATGNILKASIQKILPSGHIVLESLTGHHVFAFKEVEFLPGEAPESR